MANPPGTGEAARAQIQLHPTQSRQAQFQLRKEQRETIVAHIALIALLVLIGLAFFCPADKVVLADRVTLLVLAVSSGLLLFPPLLQLLEAQSGGVTFLLTAVMFVVYSLARRVVPENGPGLRFAVLPGDEFIFPYAAYVAVFGALFFSSYQWKLRNEWPRAILGGVAIIALLAGFSFWLLSHYYPVGPTQRLDPTSLPTLYFMLVEYGCVALLCRAVGSNPQARRLALRVLPALLLALWVRFHFFQPAEEAE